MDHRGRFQAQGIRLEESEPWAQMNPLCIEAGRKLLNILKGRLNIRDLEIRELGFSQCRACIDEINLNGGFNTRVAGQMLIKSFPKGRRERVDLEVNCGVAFITEEE